MCVVSAVGQYWANSLPHLYPNIPFTGGPVPGIGITGGAQQWQSYVTQEQFQQLRNEINELKVLLLAAKKFDESTGQPDCETEDKVALIKQIARLVGVDMKDVFPD
jgi:hypothetical protein